MGTTKQNALVGLTEQKKRLTVIAAALDLIEQGIQPRAIDIANHIGADRMEVMEIFSTIKHAEIADQMTGLMIGAMVTVFKDAINGNAEAMRACVELIKQRDSSEVKRHQIRAGLQRPAELKPAVVEINYQGLPVNASGL